MRKFRSPLGILKYPKAPALVLKHNPQAVTHIVSALEFKSKAFKVNEQKRLRGVKSQEQIGRFVLQIYETVLWLCFDDAKAN